MKKLCIFIAVAAMTLTTIAETTSACVEVYLNIPGMTLHCVDASVTFLDNGMVRVETPWGVTYTTHVVNIVIVTRKGK